MPARSSNSIRTMYTTPMIAHKIQHGEPKAYTMQMLYRWGTRVCMAIQQSICVLQKVYWSYSTFSFHSFSVSVSLTRFCLTFGRSLSVLLSRKSFMLNMCEPLVAVGPTLIKFQISRKVFLLVLSYTHTFIHFYSLHLSPKTDTEMYDSLCETNSHKKKEPGTPYVIKVK